GRGRRGRVWVSERGNLFATLLLTAPAAPEYRPQLSLVAALAVHDALVEIAGGLKRRIAIKWPNDLLMDQAKFAGILVEGEVGVRLVDRELSGIFETLDEAGALVLRLPDGYAETITAADVVMLR